MTLQRGCRQGDPFVTKIIVRNNGSLRIEGDDFTIYDAEGNAFDLAGRTSISLCRCGHSENKPFCDSKHKECGFSSEVKARALAPLAPVSPPLTTS
jgi:CDGSH-type Zn-finger protein